MWQMSLAGGHAASYNLRTMKASSLSLTGEVCQSSKAILNKKNVFPSVC